MFQAYLLLQKKWNGSQDKKEGKMIVMHKRE